MKKRLNKILLLLLSLLFVPKLMFASGNVDIKTIVYKNISDTELTLKVYQPDSNIFKGERPAIVFFFGGGWNSRTIGQFERHSQFYAEKGIVCFVADYRVKNINGTSPYESVHDAKSAVRYVRANAAKFQVDPNRIAASGGSAGGHIAAATATLEKFDEPLDDQTISCKANALVLFNPVLDISPAGYGYDRIQENFKDFSPLHNIKEGVPPTILFLGDKDYLIPIVTLEYYAAMCERVGSICELHIYEGGEHGFFNNAGHYEDTLEKTTAFFEKIGYL